jgi:hypothetical protein
MAAGWKLLGDPELTQTLKQKIVEGVLVEAGDRTIDQLEAERDAMLLELLRVRSADDAKHPSAPN